MEDTGERMIPDAHKGLVMYGEHMQRYEVIKDLVKGKKVLDVASGTGYGTKMISLTAKSVVGIDYSTEGVDYARINYGSENIEYIQGDAQNLPFEDNSFDVVVSFETIEHLDDYVMFVNEARRVLKKNGLFILSTPNDLETQHENHFHLHQFTDTELEDLLSPLFKYRDWYYQGTWIYVSFSKKEFFEKDNIEETEKISLSKSVGRSTHKATYYFVIAGNDKTQFTELKMQGHLAEHYSSVDLLKTHKTYQKQIKRDETEKKKMHKAYTTHIESLEKNISSLTTELREYKENSVATRRLKNAKNFAKKALKKAKKSITR